MPRNCSVTPVQVKPNTQDQSSKVAMNLEPAFGLTYVHSVWDIHRSKPSPQSDWVLSIRPCIV